MNQLEVITENEKRALKNCSNKGNNQDRTRKDNKGNKNGGDMDKLKDNKGKTKLSQPK